MSGETDIQGTFKLWINWTDHIVSFQRVDKGSFEALEFPTNEERFAYVFDHCATGFRIQ